MNHLQGERAMVTVKDVARETGLSVTTVSRALNGYSDVAEATRARVEAAARALDYHPNVAARSLQTNRSNAVGLVIPAYFHHAADFFWLEFIGGVASACAEQGYDVVLTATKGPGDAEVRLQRLARSRRVDGVLICDVRRDDPRVTYLQKHGLPFVAFGRTTDDLGYSFVDVDGEAGVAQAMEHLLSLSHRRVAYLGLDPRFGFSYFRLEGYRRVLSRAELPYDPGLVQEGLNGRSAHAAAEHLFRLPDRPSAIFAAADFLALAALKAAQTAGLRVPDDISIATFDDNVAVQQADPPLTAVSQPNQLLGEQAAALLLHRVANPDQACVQRLIVPTLIVRQSTGRAPDIGERHGAAAKSDGH